METNNSILLAYPDGFEKGGGSSIHNLSGTSGMISENGTVIKQNPLKKGVHSNSLNPPRMGMLSTAMCMAKERHHTTNNFF